MTHGSPSTQCLPPRRSQQVQEQGRWEVAGREGEGETDELGESKKLRDAGVLATPTLRRVWV